MLCFQQNCGAWASTIGHVITLMGLKNEKCTFLDNFWVTYAAYSRNRACKTDQKNVLHYMYVLFSNQNISENSKLYQQITHYEIVWSQSLE